MFTVQEILPDVQRVLGTDVQSECLSRINQAIEILSTEADWDPLLGYIDICVDCDRNITLPRFIDTILAVNLGGRPTIGRDRWFEHHLNGPGIECASEDRSWTDIGTVPLISDPTNPFEVVAYLDSAADNNTQLRVYGYDLDDRWIVSTESGVTVDGFLVPTVFNNPIPNPEAPLVKRIVRVSKEVTKGFVRLATLDNEGANEYVSEYGFLLGIYEPTETNPEYRRIRLGATCTWARIRYKRRNVDLLNLTDVIPLHSRFALVLMVKSLKKFEEDRPQDGEAYQMKAVQLLRKKQLSVSPPTGPSIQISDRNLIADKSDRLT